MLLGLINLGSSSAFLAFVSVGVISLAVSYGIPIAISLFHRRRDVNDARWTMGRLLGWVVNVIALLWIVFEVILFSMPTVLPATESSMNYAIVVFFGFMAISAIWYAIYARKGMFLTSLWAFNRVSQLTFIPYQSTKGLQNRMVSPLQIRYRRCCIYDAGLERWVYFAAGLCPSARVGRG